MRLDRFRRLVRPAAPTTTTASAAQTPAGNVADIDAYAEALHELMMRLDRAPTASFQHSYAGEFDVSLKTDPSVQLLLTGKN